jgi:hypothetical protein
MKKKIRSSFIILFSAFFFLLSSGVAITIHECCHKHQHAKSEHNHCHETKIYIKIDDVFIKSKTAQFSFPLLETTLFTSIQINDVSENITIPFQHPIPPLLKLAGVNFVNFTSQRIYYS